MRTELEAMLQVRGITDLIICGMHTEFCVDTTARRALELGYPVVLVADAHTTEGNAYETPRQVIRHHNATLTNISSSDPGSALFPARTWKLNSNQSTLCSPPSGCDHTEVPRVFRSAQK
ncbi:MAG: isochorismatase family protein [Betaproteobacteria bacterium]